MNGTMYVEESISNVEAANPSPLTELVRGSDRRLVEELEPVVRRQSVSLNLSSVERIDAAGIAALILLYRMAHESGHTFTISTASARVAEMLALVGLDKVLLSHREEQALRSRPRLARNAA